MPFHRGVVPIRRTLKFLESGTIVFKDRVKVLTINYNEKTEVPVAKDVRYVNESILFINYDDFDPLQIKACY